MKQKLVVLLLAVTIACAGTIPIASTAAHAGVNTPPGPDKIPDTKTLTPLARQLLLSIPKSYEGIGGVIDKGTPGTALPNIVSKFPKIGTSLIPSGTASFLFETLSGPLIHLGFGMLMNASGLTKILGGGENDAVLEEIRAQLEVITAQLDEIQRQLSDQRLLTTQDSLDVDVKAIKAYDNTLKTFYSRYFAPISVKADALVQALDNHVDPTNAETELNGARLDFYKAYDENRLRLAEITNQVHSYLVPVSNAKSVLEKLGDVILSEHRYLTSADSARIRQLYQASAATEAMAAMLEIERNTPTSPAVMDPETGKAYKTPPNPLIYDVARQEYLDNTVEEYVNLPPVIPADVVIDAGPSARATTNKTTMFMPASTRPDLFARPGSANEVQPAVDGLNANLGAGFSDWTVPSQSTLSGLVAEADNTKTVGEYLSGLNPTSPAWQAITDRKWPFVWTNTVTNPRNACTFAPRIPGVGDVQRYSGVSTDTRSVVWAPRPPLDDSLFMKDPSTYCPTYVDNEWKTRAQGGVMAARSTGVMPIDYMAHPNGTGANLVPNAVLRRSDLSGFNLTGVDLTGANLQGSNLDGATLQGTKLANANLNGVAASLIEGVPASLPSGWQLITDPADSLRPGVLVGPGANLLGDDLKNLDLRNVNLTGVISGGTDCTGCRLPPGWVWTGTEKGLLVGPGANLATRDLTGLDLHGLDLSNVDLTNSTLADTNLTGARITGAKVSGATFIATLVAGLRTGGLIGTPASLPAGWRVLKGYLEAPGAVLSAADLSGADLSNVDLTGANLAGANLTNANLTNATLTRVVLTGATVGNAVFLNSTESKLAGVRSGGLVGTPKSLPAGGRYRLVTGYLVGPNVNLSTANFPPGANLEGAQLTDANLTAARLPVSLLGASMTNAILTGATLTDATLYNADMSNAQLYGVVAHNIAGEPKSLPAGWAYRNLYLVGPGANLVNAQLAGADLTGVNLSGAFLNGADLTGVIWSNTTCPNGTVQSTPCPIGFGANGFARISAEADQSGNGLRVTVTPALADGLWIFGIERLTESGGFLLITSGSTRGGNEVALVNLPEGTYRAVVRPQRDYLGSTSAVVVVKK
jgi:uncharacterized protein YjbI with pentapeptide repeats